MEAVKRLPMICFDIKNSPEATSFHSLKQVKLFFTSSLMSNSIRISRPLCGLFLLSVKCICIFNSQCIAEYYGEDPDSYSREFRELEELRGLACRPRVDIECCNIIKRYYSQLHSLQNRFPLSSETELLNFAWKDIYSGSTWHTSNIRYEMASTLYNVAALHSKLGVEEERVDPESMKLACTHFQCAAWAFGEIKNQFGLLLRNDLSAELMIFMQQICFAQAQECILEKSLADNRKAAIIAKVTAQVISFYNAAMSALFSQNEDGSIQDLIGNKLYKDWLKYIKFKTSYLSSILFLYQGQNSEEQRKMGERLALYNAACEKLEEAKKEVKGMNKIEILNEALVLATDIIEGKRKNAKQENEFIYHEAIPEISTISAVQGANLVQGISFDVADPQIIGEDIFKRLVPMKAHENLSLYSEEKAQILRQLSAKIDERDTELASFMGSLNLELLNAMKQSQEKLPQNLVDRCAELNAKTNAIPDLIESMSNLGNICAEVEMSLNEIKMILDEENVQEANFQKQMGKRPTGHMTELAREFTKYLDAHSKAGDSNDTLRKAMELHVSNLKILAQPLSALKSQVPKSDIVDEEVRKELELLLNKVEEMKTQRDGIYNELRDQILNKDDITAQLIAHGEKDVEELFKKELKKYSQSVNIIEQNLVAQGNILKALTDTYAKHAMKLKAFNDVKSKREQFYSSLINSFDVYEDLLSKSAKGLDFYKKLHGNIQKLNSRVKAARDVQEEERQQLLKNALPKHPPIDRTDNLPKDTKSYAPSHSVMTNPVPQQTTGMKLKDYIKSGMVPGMIASIRDDPKIPAVRPSPVGQENITASNITACSNVNYPQNNFSAQYFSGPQTPSSVSIQNNNPQLYQTQNDHSNKTVSNSYNNPAYPQATSQVATGYTNPMYQSNQMYNNMNTYSQMNYNANAYQNVPTNFQEQKYPVASTPTVSNSYTMNTSAGVYSGQYYNNPQQPTMSQSSTPTPQNVYSMPQNAPSSQPAVSNVQTSNVQAKPTSTPYYQQQPTSGDFIPNIYKTQLQYPTVQSPVQNYSPASPFSMGNANVTPAVQTSTSQGQMNQQNNNFAMYQQQPQNSSYGLQTQTSQTFNQYHQNPTSSVQQPQQNVSYYNPYTSTTVAPVTVTQSSSPGQVTQPNMYYQQINANTTVTNSAGSMNQNQNVPYYQNTSMIQQQQQQPPMNQVPNTPENNGNVNIQQPAVAPSVPQNTQVNQPVKEPPKAAIKSENIDLLSDIDFSVPSSSINDIPLLQPISITAIKKPEEIIKESPKKVDVPSVIQIPVKMNEDLADLDFSSLTMTTISPQVIQPKVEGKQQVKFEDPFEDVNVLKQFHKEVESLEKYMESLTVKTLSGITPLANKWKELQDLLVKDESARSISIAKLFPDKNRSSDFLPYDHGRVLLPTSTDNYINAALVKDCGPVPFIMAQIPMENTLIDYWEMVWSQKSNVIVCLYSSSEVSHLNINIFNFI